MKTSCDIFWYIVSDRWRTVADPDVWQRRGSWPAGDKNFNYFWAYPPQPDLLTWGCMMQKMHLRACWPYVSLPTHSGASWYWIALDIDPVWIRSCWLVLKHNVYRVFHVCSLWLIDNRCASTFIILQLPVLVREFPLRLFSAGLVGTYMRNGAVSYTHLTLPTKRIV